ncbi:Pc12g08010 [Penicillium rubens Wisconsin 54-1255]|uniref:Pc12g08010 protein n=1 Tax=Penicillium rubens (strain ATCC 28089 / DSM 1075 / NRRL 1951 / Wisconsin 54-1255) TaxID=500485 RepID=B6GXN2_PENRW|nr:Pc12g08010 [Penicillium rubens Wisconsin 54-1255]
MPRRPLTPPLLENKDSKPQVPPTRRGWRLLLPKRREKQSTQDTLKQTQSPLFGCLPTEIRLLIWEHYLCSRMLHITAQYIRRKWRRDKRQIIGVLKRILYFDDISYSMEHETRRVDFTPLLQSCRRVYSEIVDIMFQNNTFHFHDWQTIIDFSHTLLPHRLSMIRILQLSFPYLDLTGWNTCCQILATKLPGLKTLTIRLLAPYRKRLVDCLMPLYQIQQPAVFTVVVTILGPDPQWEVLTRCLGTATMYGYQPAHGSTWAASQTCSSLVATSQTRNGIIFPSI